MVGLGAVEAEMKSSGGNLLPSDVFSVLFFRWCVFSVVFFFGGVFFRWCVFSVVFFRWCVFSVMLYLIHQGIYT